MFILKKKSTTSRQGIKGKLFSNTKAIAALGLFVGTKLVSYLVNKTSN